MSVTLTVLYPTTSGTGFDHGYYATTHMALVARHFGPHMVSASASKGVAGGPDTPPGFHAIATLLFDDQAKLDAALAAGGPVMADIPNYYDGAPQMLIGEVIA